MKVQVTRQNIKSGVRSVNRNPVANAIREALGTKNVQVGSDSARIDGVDYVLRRGKRFIETFNTEGRKGVRPTTVELSPLK